MSPMERWDVGDAYDAFMGRWSRLVAVRFVADLAPPPNLRWLDVGCGTGALLEALAEAADPAVLTGVDPSPAYGDIARRRLGPGVDVREGTGDDLPFDDDAFDRVVSGLVLNFVPDAAAALAEWRRVTRPGGSIHVYVWDYADGMGFLRAFWDAATAVDPGAAGVDQGARFSLCRPDALARLFDDAGLAAIRRGEVEVVTRFADFDDYWEPFLRGQGGAPAYVATLDEAHRERLRERLAAALPYRSDGSVEFRARAWTISGVVEA